MMTKLYILTFLFTTVLMISCEKDSNDAETKSKIVLNGWEISKSKYNFDINPRDLFFVNSEIGFVVGYNGDVYRTTESGKTWQKQNSGTTLHLYSVYFINELDGFISGQAMSGCLDEDCDKGSIFLQTSDGGITWSKIFFKNYTGIYSLKFFNKSDGVAIIRTPEIPNTRSEFIAITTNGGISWNLKDLEIMPYNEFFCIDNILYIASKNQKILKSKDYGLTWETIETPVEAWNDVQQIYFFNEKIGYINGSTRIYRTLNGGTSWNATDFPFSSFGVFHFYSENEGFNIISVSIYEGGDFPTFKGSKCYQTVNMGQNWLESILIDSLHLGLTYFPRRNLGYGINFSEFYTIKKKE